MAGTSLDKKTPQKTVMFVGHHGTPNDQLVWPLVEAFRPGRLRMGDSKPIPLEEEQGLVKRWTAWPHGFDQARFNYARPSEGKSPPERGQTEIVVGRPPAKHTDLRGRVTELPLFGREAGNWYEVIVGGDQIDWTNAYEMAWFLEKVRLTLPIYRPDFGFADVRPAVFKEVGDNPMRRVWPVLLYGPERVERLGGRERLLNSPVWRTEELSEGHIWLQVAENPFMATAKQLRGLATYLSLEGP